MRSFIISCALIALSVAKTDFSVDQPLKHFKKSGLPNTQAAINRHKRIHDKEFRHRRVLTHEEEESMWSDMDNFFNPFIEIKEDPKDRVTAEVEDEYGYSILLPIEVGTPGQAFDLIIDTASDWMWVQAAKCKGCTGTQRFNEEFSSTYNGKPWDTVLLQYGSGDCTGFVFTENLCIALDDMETEVVKRDCSNLKTDPFYEFLDRMYRFFYGTGYKSPEQKACEKEGQLCIDNANMLFITAMGPGMAAIQIDGIVGFTPFNSTDWDGNTSDLLMDQLVSDNVIDQKLFAIDIGGLQHPTEPSRWYYFGDDDYVFNPSHITFGGWNLDKFTEPGSELVWHNNVSDFHWGLELTQFWIDDEPFYSPKDTVHEAIIDSGNSFINLPGPIFDKIEAMVSAKTESYVDEYSNWLVTCKGYDTESWKEIFPTIQFQLDHTVYQLPISSYVMSYANDVCLVELHKMDVSYFDIYIFGLTFMENYYSVYDMENGRVGMAPSHINKLYE